MRGLRLGLSLTGGAAAFNPASLFGASDTGYVYDFTDTSKMFQNSNGTTAVAAVADPIGYATDLSGKGNHATQATAGARGLYRGVPKTLGAELTTNGTFALDASWAKGTGWTISGGLATKTAGTASNLTQAVTLTAGETYVLTFNCIQTAGTLIAELTGGSAVVGATRSASAGCYDVLIAVTGNTTLAFVADASFAGSVSQVSLKKVTAFANMGMKLNGSTQTLAIPAVDMSATNKQAIVLGAVQNSANTSVIITGGTSAGGYWITFPESADSSIHFVAFGSSANPQIGSHNTSTSGGAGGTPNTARRALTLTMEVDRAASSVTAAVLTRLGGAVDQTSVSGSAPAGGNNANAAGALGSRGDGSLFSDGLIRRVLVINRSLTTAERLSVEAWAGNGIVWGCWLGDSTAANYLGCDYAPSWVAGAGGQCLAYPGEICSQQQARWEALSTADRAAFKVVVIRCGLNDCNTLATGAVGSQDATIIAGLQALINSVNSTKSASCKVYVLGLTPAKGWLGVGSGTAAASYSAWQSMNTAIAGGGPTPITGVDARITSHVAALNVGSDNLAAAYAAYTGDGVHLNAAGHIVIGQAERAQLEADGLV